MKNRSLLLLTLGTVLLFILLQSSQPNRNPPMLQFDQNDYEKAWKAIDSLEQEGLPKSALAEVDKLYARAKADNNPAQQVKAVIYRAKFTRVLEEEGMPKTVALLEAEIEATDFPVKAVLQSVLAEFYQQYLDNSYWQINQRTNLAGEQGEDMETWTTEQFLRTINGLYLTSIADKELSRVAVGDFEAILLEGKESEGLRPTLYDVLVQRALAHFMNERSYLTEPAYKFYVDDAVVFAKNTAFAVAKFEAKDTSSFKYQTLLLLQAVTEAHLKDEDSKALIDVSLQRLKFAYSNAVVSDKDKLYLDALKQLEQAHAKHPMVSEVLYTKAKYYYDKGLSYQPNPTDKNRWDLKTAYEICTTVIADYPDTYGAKLCAEMQENIEQSTWTLRVEQVDLPNEPFLALVEYRNMPKAYLKVVRLEKDIEDKIAEKRKPEQKVALLLRQKSVQDQVIDLPADGDFQQQSVEVRFDKLPLGKYAILLGSEETFSTHEDVRYLFMTVSNIGYWHRQDKAQESEFTVFHRATGLPMEGVTAEYFMRDYDRVLRKNKLRKIGSGISDKDGYIKAKTTNNYFQVRFSKGKDVLDFGSSYSSGGYTYQPTKQYVTHFFLDRAIYRPGQTVYFKAIVLEKDKEQMPSIVSNQPIQLTFYDANHQEVAKLNLKTNDFGTVSGEFITPTSGLLGQMQIQSDLGNGAQYFRVEEYKRPKFEVNFEAVKESFKLNEEVRVSGLAQAFSGNVIDGAKVQYRVVREVRYPWIPWWYRRYYTFNSNSMEIISGTTQTDAEGKFVVEFTALPDREADPKQKPEFYYTVYADVVDITGETHSTSTNVRVGHIALELKVNVSERLARADFQQLKIDSKNLNGEFEAAKGTIKIHSLKQPKGIFINRYWKRPTKQLYSKKEFKKYFPHFAYEQEDQIQQWETGKEVFSSKFNTEKATDVDLSKAKLAAGSYSLKIETNDKYGTPITIERHFTIYDATTKSMSSSEIAWTIEPSRSFEPKETATIHAGTNTKSIPMLFEVEHDGKIIRKEWLTVKDWENIQIPIEEKHRGNLHYHISYAQYNRATSNSQNILVPWTNKELTIEYSTFRDKLSPGQEEEWQLKISGSKGEKVAAEMVAALYDASLDQFVEHNWNFNIYPISYMQRRLRSPHFSSVQGSAITYSYPNYGISEQRRYDKLDNFGLYRYANSSYPGGIAIRGSRANARSYSLDRMAKSAPPPPPPSSSPKMMNMEMEEDEITLSEGAMAMDQSVAESDVPKTTNEETKEKTDLSAVPVRTNLNETVFLMPELKTDKDGNIIIKFKMNEALTKWKFLGFAHTKELEYGLTQNEVVTQKELMVQPNPPRFMREDDSIVFTAKVSNLTEKELTGSAQIQLFDATTMQPVDDLFDLKAAQLSFKAAAGQSARLAWTLQVPSVAKVPALVHRVVAKAGDFSDGEESALPILTNRMLVTETMPLPVRGKENKEFVFASLQNAAASNTLEHQSLSLEFTSNPAWYAVQSLPYLMEYPHECIEQVFNRYYANSLATSIANAHPRVKEVFNRWKDTDADALKSNLSKNQELKYALLEETPWVLQAQSEEEQKRNIGLLFDLNRMADEQTRALDKIIERQRPDGGFSWFAGARHSNWYMTQYIVEGLGHLDKLGVQSIQNDPKVVQMLRNAIQFIDEEVVDYYNKSTRSSKKENDHLTSTVIHYLYTRSFFLQYPMSAKLKTVTNYYLDQADEYWLKKSIYQQGMIALALQRMERKATPNKIVKSLKERAIYKEEMGMYWKYDYGYHWHQLPIETHALLIEVFDEVAQDAKSVEELKIWLLKTKQTTHWKTTKATAAAVYALLMNGDNWLLEDQLVEVNFDNAGNPEIHSTKIQKAQQSAEAGTGYFKAQWAADEITPDMATVSVDNPNKSVAWGAVYWQYFEQLDKIDAFEETPLKLKKQLYKEVNSPTGPKLIEINEKEALEAGNKLKVRIELRVDRPMEYVHMKDARASGFEPINVLSQYKWQGGLGYYESTRDASTNFFFSYLPKGTFVFEYPLRVVHAGDFSNGITTIQCMYAPEFTSHSEGIRIQVQ